MHAHSLHQHRSFAEAIERLHNIERRLGSCQLMPTADPGAALLGDYAFVPGPPAPVRPEPDYIKASIRAGDLLPALLWPDSPTTPPAVEQLRLPEDVAVKLVHVRPLRAACCVLPAATWRETTALQRHRDAAHSGTPQPQSAVGHACGASALADVASVCTLTEKHAAL